MFDSDRRLPLCKPKPLRDRETGREDQYYNHWLCYFLNEKKESTLDHCTFRRSRKCEEVAKIRARKVRSEIDLLLKQPGKH